MCRACLFPSRSRFFHKTFNSYRNMCRFNSGVSLDRLRDFLGSLTNLLVLLQTRALERLQVLLESRVRMQALERACVIIRPSPPDLTSRSSVISTTIPSSSCKTAIRNMVCLVIHICYDSLMILQALPYPSRSTKILSPHFGIQ